MRAGGGASRADLSFFLFPLGIGETNVASFDEVPVVLTATASTAASAQTSGACPAPELGRGLAASSSAPLAETDVGLGIPQRAGSVGLVLPSSALFPGKRAEGEPAAVDEAVIHLTGKAASSSSASPTFAAQGHRLLEAQLGYLAARHLRDPQRGSWIEPRVAREPSVASTTAIVFPRPLEPHHGFAECAGGRRLYAAYPVEEGRYGATVVLPAAIWRRLGGGGDGTAFAEWLMFTSLQSSPLPARAICGGESDAAHRASTVHQRLSSDPREVQQRMQSQVRLLAAIAAQGAAQPQMHAEREMALRSLCREQPSSLRTHPRLWGSLDMLMRAAVNTTDAASLRGALATEGVPQTERRYVLSSSAVWYRGLPLYRSHRPDASAPSAKIAAVLRIAALSVVLEELGNAYGGASQRADIRYSREDDAVVRLTAQCLRWALPLGSAGAPFNVRSERIGGCVDQRTPSESGAASSDMLALAVTSSAGWTVALILRPSYTPFLGAPISSIFSGVRHLVEVHFQANTFCKMVQEATAAMRTAWRRPVALLSPLMVQLETAVRCIRVGRRPAPSTSFMKWGADVLLFHFDHQAATTAAKALGAAEVPRRGCSTLLGCAKDSTAQLDPSTHRSRMVHHCGQLGFGEVFAPRGSQTVGGGGGTEVEGILQAAMRYVQLERRLRRCCGLAGGSVRLRDATSRACFSASHRRSQVLHSVLSAPDVVRVVYAAPHCTSGGDRTAQSAVLYVVMDLERAIVPPRAYNEYRAFTSWILSKCL